MEKEVLEMLNNRLDRIDNTISSNRDQISGEIKSLREDIAHSDILRQQEIERLRVRVDKLETAKWMVVVFILGLLGERSIPWLIKLLGV